MNFRALSGKSSIAAERDYAATRGEVGLALEWLLLEVVSVPLIFCEGSRASKAWLWSAFELDHGDSFGVILCELTRWNGARSR